MSCKKLSRSVAGTLWAAAQSCSVILLAVSAMSVTEATVKSQSFAALVTLGSQLQKAGDVVKREIRGGETLTFPVRLPAGEYAKFRVEQHGSILVVSLFDPQGKEITQMDNPSGGHGPIIFSTIASLTGDYSIHVLSKDKWANPANFELIIDEVRSPRTEDQSVIAAQRAFAEGRRNSRNANPAAALPHYERSLAMWKSANDERWQALTHFAMSEAYRTLGARERPKAMKELEAALAILSRNTAPNDWRLKAATLNDLGSSLTLTGQMDRGISLLNEALNLFLVNSDRRGEASSLNNLAIAHGGKGDFSLARELVQRALPLRYAENDQVGAINLKNTLGGIFDALGEPEKAVKTLDEAFQEWQKLGELAPDQRKRVATLLGNLAAASDKLGQWEKARDYYDRALTMFREGDQGRAATLANKGELYASLGDFQKARHLYDEALSLLPAEKFDSDIKASILLYLGQLFLLQGELPNAVKSFEEARDAKPNNRKLADVLTNLGVAFVSQGKLHEAMQVYQQALAIQLEQRDKRGQALTLQKRGETHHSLKQQPQALEDLNNALALWESVKDVRGAAATLDAMARVERDRGNFTEALRYNNRAIDIVESQRTTLSSHRLKTLYFATQESYYELNIDLNMQLRKSTGEIQYLAQAFETSEKARARVLLDALGEGTVGRDANQPSDPKLSLLLDQRPVLLRQLTAKAQARTKLLNTIPNPNQLAALDREIDAISEKIDSLETQIRSQNPRFDALTRPQPSNLNESQKQLDPHTLLIEYALGEKRSYVWVVTSDSINGFELPPRKQIEDVARRLRDVFSGQESEETKESPNQRKLRTEKEHAEASAELSRLVLGPIATSLNRKRLVVVPDGALQLISFGALPLPNKSNAGETDPKQSTDAIAPRVVPAMFEHEVVYLPSASVLVQQRREQATRKPARHAVAILANPVFEPGDERVSNAKKKNNGAGPLAVAPPRLEPWKEGVRDLGIDKILTLHFSGREANDIRKLVPEGEAFVATGFEANRTTAMSPKLANYRIVHFATHGILNLEHPELSGIVFSLIDEKGNPQDGFLYLHDIYNLNLPAELVVLSACQTGVGKQVKGEGLIALTRGFMYAGASRLVASLWKVDDAATAELMARFYKEMFTNGKRPAEALRDAQLDLSKQRRFSSPYFWAGFVLQGEWR